MRALLVGPDHEDNLSIRYLSAALRAAGHEAELAAFNEASDIDSVVTQAAEGYDLIGLSMCFQGRLREYLTLARALREAGHRWIVAGGHYATCEADALLRHHPEIDLVAVHEAEETIVELARVGPDPAAWASIPGLRFRDAAGEVVATEPRRSVTDLEALPNPDRRGKIHLFAGVPTAYLMASRGCVATCDYCCIVTLHRMAPGRKFRQRSMAHVVQEMAALYHHRGIRQFIFHDDNWLVPRQSHNHARIDDFERELSRHGLTDIGFTIKCRPPDAHREVFTRLKGLGLLRVFLGVESSSEEGLCSIGRKQTVAQSEAALELCRELDISAQYTMMAFHPDATLDTLRSDIAFMRTHDVHALNWCRTEIYAGTPLEAKMIREGRAFGDYRARAYRIADPVVDLACDVALKIFGPRNWAMGELMERVIGADHLSAVVGHFYRSTPGEAERARRIRDRFRDHRLRANHELVEMLSGVVEAAAVAKRVDDPGFVRDMLALTEREIPARRALNAELDVIYREMDAFVLERTGLERRGGLRPRRRALGHLATHAAAVMMAFAAATGCDEPAEDGPEDMLPEEPFEDQEGIAEFAPAPLEPMEPLAPRPEETTPDEPEPDEPGTDEPGTDEPGTEEPGTDEPGTDESPSDDEEHASAADDDPPEAEEPPPRRRRRRRRLPVSPPEDHPGIAEFAPGPLKPEGTIERPKARVALLDRIAAIHSRDA